MIASALAPHGDIRATSRRELDLANPDSIVATITGSKPWLIVNAAAYTAVDRAEDDVDAAFAVNARAPAILADEARRCGALLIHFSTDYVFDGNSRTSYAEDAPTAPLNVYGASKLAGEQAIASSGVAALVFRTSWVYGASGSNFLTTIRRLARERDELRIVADQVGVPNWTHTLADAVQRIVAMGEAAMAERSGLYHLSSAGQASWYDFAKAIVGEGSSTRVVPITTAEFVRPARRPAHAVLDTAKFQASFGFALPHWRSELASCLQEFPV
ncbi:MAG: dTDP-4-dehydrorhamnose reductase [Pseudomonadota bacterium]|nr:dTDP-4-dehydrorhamnose reductase [Pseudomonadota bacterium]